jgi:nucleotide-binding universal stress UspA family protein
VRTPFRKILCPTDLSPVGNSAVKVAYSIADAGSTVHLLFVMSPPEMAALALGKWAPAYLPTPEERREAEEKVRDRLRRVVPLESLEEGVRTEIHVEHGLPVADRIEKVALERDVDVVVMGTHGRSGIGRVLLGSVAGQMLRRKGVSVLLVHDDRVVHPQPHAEEAGSTRAHP